MPNYHIAEYDYTCQNHQVVATFTELYNALEYLFARAINYLQDHDGYEKVARACLTDCYRDILFSRAKFRSHLKATLAPGHYIVRDPTDHLHKIEIWRKTVSKSGGWIYGEYVADHWTKVLDLDVISAPNQDRDFGLLAKLVSYINGENQTGRDQATRLAREIGMLESFKRIAEGIKLSVCRAEFPQEFGIYRKTEDVATTAEEEFSTRKKKHRHRKHGGGSEKRDE